MVLAGKQEIGKHIGSSRLWKSVRDSQGSEEIEVKILMTSRWDGGWVG